MLTDMDRYRNAALDAKFQAAVLKISPDLRTRYSQIQYFRQYKGPRCTYVKTGIRLLMIDMKGRGFKLEGGTIRSPEGETLWPMT